MHHPETGGEALLAIAERTLVEEVLPAVPEDRRAAVLMIASALRMVAREMAQAAALEASAAALAAACPADGATTARGLVAAIRSGALDADRRLHAALWADAVARTSVSKPSFLARRELRLVDPDASPS